jgi:hypothetical protein
VTEVDSGWPVVFVTSDLIDAASGLVRGRRFHAFFRFYVDCAIAWLSLPEGADLADTLARVKPLLKSVAPLYGAERVRCLEDIWDADVV